ncbi:MAG: fibrobacter succinogenes major paralogous domain-containing protein [Prolixibacteraceae bacterium]|nr:fibrobacter succinogenes major paralogous domain-containing protein [Prolixibacteraceae bacterium]
MKYFFFFLTTILLSVITASLYAGQGDTVKSIAEKQIQPHPTVVNKQQNIVEDQGTTLANSESTTHCIVDDSFTDSRDGKVYKTVKIGNQTWMAENLNYTASSGSWCHGNDNSNCNKYGRLYDWETAKKVCPSGWHLPSNSEWETMVDYLGGESVAGGEMKTTGTTHWHKPNNAATNLSGFAALPGGSRLSSSSFNHIGYFGYWWSSSEYTPTYAWHWYIGYNFGYMSRGYDYKTHGFSVRCVRDN